MNRTLAFTQNQRPLTSKSTSDILFGSEPTFFSRRNLHPLVKVDQAGRPLPPKKTLHFVSLSVETDISA